MPDSTLSRRVNTAPNASDKPVRVHTMISLMNANCIFSQQVILVTRDLSHFLVQTSKALDQVNVTSLDQVHH